MQEMTKEMRVAVAAERLKREEPGTDLVLNELHRSSNEKVRKIAMQYERGLITFAELEHKVREVLKNA